MKAAPAASPSPPPPHNPKLLPASAQPGPFRQLAVGGVLLQVFLWLSGHQLNDDLGELFVFRSCQMDSVRVAFHAAQVAHRHWVNELNPRQLLHEQLGPDVSLHCGQICHQPGLLVSCPLAVVRAAWHLDVPGDAGDQDDFSTWHRGDDGGQDSNQVECLLLGGYSQIFLDVELPIKQTSLWQCECSVLIQAEICRIVQTL